MSERRGVCFPIPDPHRLALVVLNIVHYFALKLMV